MFHSRHSQFAEVAGLQLFEYIGELKESKFDANHSGKAAELIFASSEDVDESDESVECGLIAQKDANDGYAMI